MMKPVYALLLLLLTAIADSAIAETPPRNADAAKQSASAPATKPVAVLPPGHVPINTKPVDLENIKVPKANGPDARTVAEVVTKRIELKDKMVLVRGKVVKFTPEILNKNWMHLRDGSGSDSDNTNDVLVTTNDHAKAGDVVTIKGVVHIDKDFGSGYSYKVLIEEATLQK